MKALSLSATILTPLVMFGQATSPDTSTHIAFGGFVDTYYAYDFGRPENIDRLFTTQAIRHNEFNVNLAFVDLTLTGERVRGHLAVQFGTSVQSNYAAEPRVGSVSGPDVSRFIQEATAGYKLTPALWLDAGIMLSPLGAESWISRDNWTYTRSLISEESPYYEAGVRATWQVTSALTAQLHIINGWQNISETNSDKAVVARLDYVAGPRLTLAYDLFAGNEAPDSSPARTRVLNEFVAQVAITEKLSARGTLDIGDQRRESGGNGWDRWGGFALIGHFQSTPRMAIGARVEQYSDPQQVIVATGQIYGLRAWSGSVNLDVAPVRNLLWRAELRFLRARDSLFPDRSAASGLSRDNTVAVSSLAFTF